MRPHEEWLRKAGQDLESARILFDSGRPVLDMAVYHTQQCAEKALKGFLAWKGEEIDKTHYLPGLLTECAEFEPSFAGLSEAALRLNPYSSLYRYPHGGEGPGRLEAERALAFALEILDFAKERIAAPPPPPRQG